MELSPDGDPDDWQSDDSDWLCTDDEEFGSDGETRKKNRQCKSSSNSKCKEHQTMNFFKILLKICAAKKGKDDGNLEDFFRRIKLWERQNEGLREQMEEDVHEFENGYRLPALIWDKLYT